MIYELVKQNRSYRRFDESYELDRETLVELIELARLSPSGSNKQPLKYILSNDREKNAQIFSCLGWAGHIKDWPGPAEGERPTGYIVILGDTTIKKEYQYDPGIVAQTMLLGAIEKGLGGCMLSNLDKKKLRDVLAIDEQFDLLLVIALGKPVEEVVIDTVGEDGSTKYWRDENQVHHVPKRKLDDLILSE